MNTAEPHVPTPSLCSEVQTSSILTRASTAKAVSHSRAAVACLFAAAALALAGCSKPTAGSSIPARPLLVIALDRSGSMAQDEVRFAQFEALDACTNHALVKHMPTAVFLFDSEPMEVYGPRVPHSEEDMYSIKQTLLHPGGRRRYTRPARLLSRLLTVVEKRSSQQVLAVLLTDGDSELARDEPLFRDVASKLRNAPGLRMLVAGIRPENRQRWRTAFDGMDDRRLRLAGPGPEMSQAVPEFLQAAE